jgi:hypothetical protein
MKKTIANQWALDKIIDERREITQKLILEAPETAPDANHRNRPKIA